MSKAVRINVLVITIVVTLFVFAGLWYMRPGVPNEILEQARQRQTVPLMEVQPPPIKPSVEQVSNTQALAKELLPTLAKELEGTLATSIRSRLLADQSLVSELSKAVEPLLVETLQSQLETFRQEMGRSMLNDLQALKTSLETEATAYGSRIQSELSERIANNKAELLSLLPQLVDAKLPQVVEQVVAQLEANKESYLASMRESLAPSLQESDLLVLYDTYRDQIVLDLVPSLLDGIEETVRTEVNAYVAEMPLVRVPKAPAMSSPSVKVVAQPEPIPVVEAPPAPKAEPIPAQPVVIQPELAPVPAQPMVVEPKAEPVLIQPVAPSVPKTVQTTVVVEAPPVPKQGQPIITVPVFEEKETIVFLTPEEYEKQRQEIRTKAIEDVLKRIAP